MKYLTPAQVHEIQGQVKRRGFNSVSLAAHLGHPWSTVAGVMNGTKRTPAVRAKIAAFLGLPPEDLFGGNGGP